MNIKLLKEFIRSRLESSGGAYLAMAMKNIGSTTRVTFYDPYKLANAVENGEQDPEIPIVGKAVISERFDDIDEFDAKPEYLEVVKRIVEAMKKRNSGEFMELVRNHYRMVTYLKNKGRERTAATLTYSIV